MASHGQPTLETPEPPEFARGAQFVEYEEFIETQLRRTRSHVRSVDLAAGVMLLLAGTLSYFLVATLVDHWLFTGGLGFWGRLVLFLGFVAGATWWIATQLVPLVIKRINPLYAAHTIERSRPSLKNSLVNFLLFRSQPGAVHERVLEAIEEQAATNLVGMQVDSAVDRSRLIKLGYVLIGIFALCAIYAVVSPKNMFKTVGRVVMPWADILPPTRTTIDEIEPGDVQAFRGQQVTVKANVQGVAEGSPVTLFYTTADRQIVERPIEMSRPAGEYRYTAVLPAADAELQQSLTYKIQAGDATTRTYSVDVVAAPTIVVKSVEYKYPAYTGLLTQRIEHQGDLKAIEGTEVTLETLANQDIASGYVDFDANNSLDLPLRGEGPRAKASFKLLLKEDRQAPEHTSYQLTFKNAAGQQNPQPIRHQIEVTRDVSPEVQFVAPERDEVEVPVDGAIDLEVVANDPDFALASVKLVMMKGKKQAEERLLNEAWRGQFVKKYHFQPRKLKLAVGDTIEYWAVAVDNKSPRPNQSETARRKIVVVAPAASANDANAQGADGGEQAAGGAENGKPGDDPSKADDKQAAGDEASSKSGAADPASEPKAGEEPQAGDGAQSAEAASAEKSPEQKPEEKPQQSEKPQPGGGEPGADGGEGASQAGNSGESQAGEKPSAGEQADGGAPAAGEEGGGETQDSVASDGTNDGDAFERILQDREEQAKQQPQDGQKQQGGEQQQGEQQQGGEQNSGEPQAGDKQGQQQAGDQQGGDQQGGAGEQNKQQGGQKGGQEQGDGQQGEGQQQGESQGGKQQGGKQSDAQKSGAQKSDGAGESQQGEKSDGAQGEGQQGKSAGQKPDGKQAGQQGQGQLGQGQPQGQGQQQGQGQKGKSDPNAGANDAAQQSNQSSGDKNGGQQSDPNAKQSDTKGEGAQSKGDSSAGGKPEAAPKGEQRPDARGGDGESEKGESGAGQPSEDKQGSPSAQDANAPRDKSSQSRQQGGEKNESEEQSPSNSKRESDTEGDEDGDRSGGGKRGGGQKANQSGTGGAGQNTAADEGADRSEQAGGSETSGRAGEDQAADGKTGKSGQQQGKGSQQRPAGENGAPGGEQSQPSDGSQAGGKQQGEAADGTTTESADGTPSDQAGDQAGEQASDSQQGQPSGEPGEGSEASPQRGDQKSAGSTRSDGAKSSQEEGVGNPDENSEGAEAAEPNGQGSKSIVPPKREWEAGTDKADQANLDYTRKATDLAIKHLKDELAKGPADPKVLDKLGWTRQDAEKFVERWEAMRSGAKSTEKAAPGGTRQLDDALRSLGLRPRSTTLSGSAARDDRTQGLEESRRTRPPAEYSEAFKAYTQGTTRGGK